MFIVGKEDTHRYHNRVFLPPMDPIHVFGLDVLYSFKIRNEILYIFLNYLTSRLMKRGLPKYKHIFSFLIIIFILVSICSFSVGNPSYEIEEESIRMLDQYNIELNSTGHSEEISTDDFSIDNSTEDSVVVDIMIAYTSNAKDWASDNDGSIHNTIDGAINNANTAMDNSEIDLTINLVHSVEVDYSETGDDLGTDLNNLETEDDGHMEEIHDLRDYYGADLVSLFVRRDEDVDFIGIAKAPHFEFQLYPGYAFSVVSVQDISSRYVFTHELGHNFGAGHAKDQEEYPGPQLYDYSAGYRWSGDNLFTNYVSVMTYMENFGDERVLYFSNPDVYHGGDSTGVEDYADNARTIRETKEIISNYQEPTPQIDITYPSGDEEWYQGDEYEIEWDTIRGENGISHVDLYYSPDNGTSWETIQEGVVDTGSYTWELPLIESSSVLVNAVATDGAGFSRADISDDNFEIKVDDVLPDVEIRYPIEGQIFQNRSLTLTWEGIDELSGIDHYEVTSDADEWETWMITERSQHTFDYLEDGEHHLGVRAVDKAGNERTVSVNVTVDTSIPVVDISNPSDGDEFEPGDITFSWEGYDNVTGISYFEIRLGNEEWSNLGDGTHYTFEELGEGEYNFTVRAVDRAGNTVTEKVEFEVREVHFYDPIVDILGEYLWIVVAFLAGMLFAFVLTAKFRSSDGSIPKSKQNTQPESDTAECGGCGAVIPGNVASCPNCGVEFNLDTMKCNNCKAVIPSDASSCQYCGTRFSSTTVECKGCGTEIKRDSDQCPVCDIRLF